MNDQYDSATSIFEDTAKQFVVNFSTHLSNWLKINKDFEISSEEVCAAFNVPFKAPITPGLPPAMEYGTNCQITTKRKSGKKKKLHDPNHPKCIYVYLRGKKEGQTCKTPVLNNGDVGSELFCKNCLAKAGTQRDLEKIPSKSKIHPPSLDDNTVSVLDPQTKLKEKLDVHEIDDMPGFYKEVDNGFIVKVDETDNSLLTKQIFDEETGEARSLTDEEKQKALSIGIDVENEQLSAPQIPIE